MKAYLALNTIPIPVDELLTVIQTSSQFATGVPLAVGTLGAPDLKAKRALPAVQKPASLVVTFLTAERWPTGTHPKMNKLTITLNRL